MPKLKEAKKKGLKVAFSKTEPDKLFIEGKFVLCKYCYYPCLANPHGSLPLITNPFFVLERKKKYTHGKPCSFAPKESWAVKCVLERLRRLNVINFL